jgi:hypothetical protein
MACAMALFAVLLSALLPETARLKSEVNLQTEMD